MSTMSEMMTMTRRLAGVWERQWEEDPLGCNEDEVDRSTMVWWHQTPSGIYVDLRLPDGAPGRRRHHHLRGDRPKRPEALLANAVVGVGIGECCYTQDEASKILEQKSFAGRLECALGDTTDGRALKDDSALAKLASTDTGVLPLCTCFWVREIDYQPPSDRLDVGVCASGPMNVNGTVDMRETGDDGSYAEGWRRVANTSDGPFVALELISENGKTRKGYWVRTGNRFAYAVGRPEDAEAASSLACPLLSAKVKECKGMSLSEAVKSMTNSKHEEMAIAASYVGLVGEVKENGTWLINYSSQAELVDCILVASDSRDPLCCSTLRVSTSNDSDIEVGEGTLLDQTIRSNSKKGGEDVVRRWKIVELSSSDSLPPSL